MKTVGVVAALSAEARALRRCDGCLVTVSGIGGTAAASAAAALVGAGASALMSFGMAGGLDPRLAAGDVLLPAEIIGCDGERFDTARAWRERLSAALSACCAVRAGIVLTAERSIDSPQAKADAFRNTGASAVDMESVSVARIAAGHRVPFLCVRVIVDTAADTLPRAVLAASESGQLRMTRLLAGLIAAPADLAPLLHLAQRYRRAMRALHAVARSGPLAPLDSEAGFA